MVKWDGWSSKGGVVVAFRLMEISARRLTLAGLRFYQIDGVLYISVTSVLGVVGKPELVRWAKSVALEAVAAELAGRETITPTDLAQAIERARGEPERIRDEAAQRGSARHRIVARALASREGVEWSVLRALALTPCATEYTVLSRQHGFAGTCDLVAETADGCFAVVDWKSGGVWPEHALQVGAYALAIQEMTGRAVTHGFVVGLKGSDPQLYEVDVPVAKEGFLAALGLFRVLQCETLLQYGRSE